MDCEFVFRKAAHADRDEILEVWKSVKGHNHTVWDDSYPTSVELDSDLASGVMYCITSNGRIIATGSFYRVHEHDSLAPWTGENPCDLMRISTSLAAQGHGTGRMMLKSLVKTSKDAGFDSMRILVAKTNLPACHLYLSEGAIPRGESVSYGIEWNCLEIVY